MSHLAIDLLGGDKSSSSMLSGALLALEANQYLSLTLVGDIGVDAIPLSVRSRVTVVVNKVTVSMDDSPINALRNKTNSSMAESINLHAQGLVDGVVSAGNTGALVGFGVQILGLVAGVSRPAIGASIPTEQGKTWLLDIGATLQLSAERLVELARLGAALSKVCDGIKAPKVGLLNIGSEENKGTAEMREAAKLMAGETDYDFKGYVEGNQLFSGHHDVVVCDGFSGNVAIKTAQGISKWFRQELEKVSKTNWLAKCCIGLLRLVLKKSSKRFDPALYNGAPLLGLKGLVVKSHGNADEHAFSSAILIAADMADKNLLAAVNSSARQELDI